MVRVLCAALAVLLILSPCGFAGQHLPKNADPSQIGKRNINKGSWNFYSPERELEMGREMAHQAEQSMVLLKDPEVDAYITELADRIARHSDVDVPIQARVVDSDEVNAFALPGGYFFVNTGLILQAQSEAELAAVIAHEIAHVAARHATRQMTKAQLFNYASLPLLFVGGGIPYAISQGLQFAVPLTFLRFSRTYEKQADFLGLQYMYAAGYDPVAFEDFFERAKKLENQKGGGISRAFATHPMTKDRITAAQKVIENDLAPRDQYVVTTSRFAEMQARLRALLDVQPRRGSGPVLRRGAALDVPLKPGEKQ